MRIPNKNDTYSHLFAVQCICIPGSSRAGEVKLHETPDVSRHLWLELKPHTCAV